uniref:Uncharacterized protein n=1 Tax=Arundo donax TaxID=35708 RepID=A0A0A9ER08_ARUDO
MNVWSIGSQRTPICDGALNGLVSGWGDRPEKLHQECLINTLLQVCSFISTCSLQDSFCACYCYIHVLYICTN